MRQSSFMKAAVSLVRRSAIELSVPLLIGVGSAAFMSQAGAATPPPNDFRVNATVIPSLPFSETIDVSGATSDADDSVGLSQCFPGSAFTINNSVWYSYTTATDITLVIDLSATDFGAGVVTTSSDGRIDCEVNSAGDNGRNGQMYTHIGAGATVSILIFKAGPLSADSILAVSFYAVTVPANDTIGGATVIHSLPFTDIEDTFLATSDADDVQLNATCGLPSTDNSVWYRFTAGSDDTSVLFDTTGSGPLANFGIIVATGTPGSLTTLACGSGAVVVPTSPGTTYYALVSGGYGTRGGRLQLDVEPTPPPPAIDASFDGTGIVDHAGIAYLSGTYSCSNALFAFIGARATQGKRSGGADISDALLCDGQRHGFQAAATELQGDVVGRFVPGNVDVQFQGIACNVLGCTNSVPSTQVVKLFMDSPHH